MSEEGLWPQDVLAKDGKLVEGRIMMFGYDSRRLAGERPNFRNAPLDLLNDLTAERNDDSQASIIFIGHSIGGPVI